MAKAGCFRGFRRSLDGRHGCEAVGLHSDNPGSALVTSQSRRYIADQHHLHALCQQLAECRRVGLDTEFVGEETFVPKLELIQVSMGPHSVAIDVRGVESLSPLGEILAGDHILKVLHAGRQDMEIFRTHLGLELTPIFDTQVAAAMVGYGTQIGYAQLVQRVFGKELEKSHTLTNWSHRPLTQEQIAYALADVDYLLPLHEHLERELTALGRIEWCKEECERSISQPFDASRDPKRRYERIRGWDRLKPPSVAVLRELAAWREEEARRRNVPRGRVARDEALLELARRKPKSVDELRTLRGLSPSVVDRYSETLFGLIRSGLSVPKSELPQIPRTPKVEPDAAGRVELLQAVLKACARQAAIAPTLLATVADLQALVSEKGDKESLDIPLLKGWRRELAGDTVLRVLTGDAAVAIDPKTGGLKIRTEC